MRDARKGAGRAQRPHKLRNKELVLVAVRSEGYVLEYVATELKAEREAAAAAAQLEAARRDAEEAAKLAAEAAAREAAEEAAPPMKAMKTGKTGRNCTHSRSPTHTSSASTRPWLTFRNISQGTKFCTILGITQFSSS